MLKGDPAKPNVKTGGCWSPGSACWGGEHCDTLGSHLNHLLYVLVRQRKPAEAEREARRLLPVFERALGPDHRYTLMLRSNLAVGFNHQGRSPEAERENRDVLSARWCVLWPGTPRHLVQPPESRRRPPPRASSSRRNWKSERFCPS